MKHITYLLLFLIPLHGLAQTFSPEEQHEIDSISAIINSPNTHDTIKAIEYIAIANYYYLKNPDTAIVLCEKAKNLSESSSFTKGKAESYGWLGYLIQSQGDLPKALEYHQQSLKIQEELGGKSDIAIALNNIGLLYNMQGDIPKALEYYHRSLKMREEIGDKKGIASSLGNLGVIYDSQGDMPKALECYHKALKLKEEIGDKRSMPVSLNNIGFIYEKQGDMPKALEYYHKSLKIGEEVGDKRLIAITLNNFGSIYNKQDDLPKALEYYHQALKIHEEIKYKRGMAISLNCIGEIELDKGNAQEAQKYSQRSLAIAQEIGYPNYIQSAAGLLSMIYEKQNKGIAALEMYKLFVTMRDSINNEATQKASAQQQAKYEYEKQKAIDDAENDKLLAIEQEEKEKQQILTAATAGGLGLVVVFLIFVFNRLRVTKKQKLVIETQKKEVEQQKEEVETAHLELEEKNKEITDSINYAQRIQEAILPPEGIVRMYLRQCFVYYQPKDVVAGDFYWLESAGDRVLFAAADCTGHGVPGAMVSLVCHNALNNAVKVFKLTEPAAILDKVNEIVTEQFATGEYEIKDGMDISLVSLNTKTREAIFAGANNPLYHISGGELSQIKGDKQPIGMYAESKPFKSHSIQLKEGESIYLFSDGYVDQFGGEKGKKFKARAFRELLLSIQDKPMEAQKQLLDECMVNWRGDLEQVDDICIIGVRT